MSWGNPQTWTEKALVRLLWPASLGLALATYCRLAAYSKGLLRQKKLVAKTISIGNITCGGTGKTPVTIDIAARLLSQGRKVAVLSRGYKRQSQQPLLVVSDGQGQLAGCTDAGDEPYLIARSLPGCVVIVGAKRVETATIAIEKYGCDTILLDDGFQHLAVARDCDLVLLDYNDDILNDHLLPAGRLREPITSLARASWIVLTKVPQSPDVLRLENLRSLITRLAPQAQVTSCRMGAHELVDLSTNAACASLTSLHNKRILAFSGIARPAAFTAQLEELGAEVVEHRCFGDHHWYTADDINIIRELSTRLEIETIVTTEKDAVKLDPKLTAGLTIMVLKQEIQWLGPVPLVATGAGSPVDKSVSYR